MTTIAVIKRVHGADRRPAAATGRRGPEAGEPRPEPAAAGRLGRERDARCSCRRARRRPPGPGGLAVLDNADQGVVLGYHDLSNQGQPMGKVFAGTDLQYGADVGVTLSHETLEILIDPWCNQYAFRRHAPVVQGDRRRGWKRTRIGYLIDGGARVRLHAARVFRQEPHEPVQLPGPRDVADHGGGRAARAGRGT